MSMPGSWGPNDGPWYECEECGCLMLAPAALCADCEDELNDDDDDEEEGQP